VAVDGYVICTCLAVYLFSPTYVFHDVNVAEVFMLIFALCMHAPVLSADGNEHSLCMVLQNPTPCISSAFCQSTFLFAHRSSCNPLFLHPLMSPSSPYWSCLCLSGILRMFVILVMFRLCDVFIQGSHPGRWQCAQPAHVLLQDPEFLGHSHTKHDRGGCVCSAAGA
jgi:hypothetical protein